VPFVIFIVFLCVIVWTLALARIKVPLAHLQRINPLHIIGVMVILVGSVFGYEFFNVSVITFDRLLLGGLVALAGFAWLLNKESLRVPNGMDAAIFLVVGVIAFSAITHDFRFSGGLPIARLLFFYMMPLALYLVVRTAKLNSLDLAAITTALGVLAVYLALTGIAEVKQMHAIVFPRYIVESTGTEFFGRGRGPFLNPVSNGIFQVAGFCCILFWWPKATGRWKVLLLGVAFLIAIGCYATLTRSVWLTLFLVVGIGFWLTTKQHQKGTLVIAGTLAALLLLPVLGDKVLAFKRDKNVSVEDMSDSAKLRPLFLKVATRMFEDRPMLGCGFGQYAREKYPYLQDAYTGQPLSKTKGYLQHNVFLAYLTEMGLIGLTALLIMLGVIAKRAWLLWTDMDKPIEQRQFGFLMAAVLLGFSVNGMFHDTSIMPMVNYLLLFVAGIVNNIQTAPVTTIESVPNGATKVPRHPLPQHGSPATS
jgi:hypothetical protein